MAPTDLLAALSSGDTVRLSTIPGIGKKTAERMVYLTALSLKYNVGLFHRQTKILAREQTAPLVTGPVQRFEPTALAIVFYFDSKGRADERTWIDEGSLHRYGAHVFEPDVRLSGRGERDRQHAGDTIGICLKAHQEAL